jgi:hypothetical protein
MNTAKNYFLFVCFFWLLSLGTAPAQSVQEVAPTYNTTLRYAKQPVHLSLLPTLMNIPFLDDFSYNSVYPTSLYWADHSVYVNNGMAINPPSNGVATFDGLNAQGEPYLNGYGWADTLTSLPFALAAYTESDAVFLSLYVQPRGNGDTPETTDSLVLEFLEQSGTWTRIYAWQGLASNNTPPFAGFSQFITTPYLYDGFQFRLRNKASRTGFTDIWNVDYIKLANNSQPISENPNFTDVTQVKPADYIVKNYTAIPLNHFQTGINELLNDAANMTLYNHFNQQKSITQRYAYIYERQSNITILPTQTLPFVNMDVDEQITLNDPLYLTPANFSVIPPTAQTATIVAKYYYDVSGQDNVGALNLQYANDTITSTTTFDRYFAHDDGTAEANIAAFGLGTQIAVQFHAYTNDTLRGVMMHIPYVAGNVSLQNMNLYGWINQLDDSPEAEHIFADPIYIDSINGYATYAFSSPVFIPANTDFYVGWQQGTATNSPIPVGLDKNQPTATQYAFQNLGTSWQNLPANISGAVMLRPIVGAEPLIIASTNQPTKPAALLCYPNPTTNTLHWKTPHITHIHITDALGRTLLQTTPQQQKIETSMLPNGIYTIFALDSKGNTYNARFAKQ